MSASYLTFLLTGITGIESRMVPGVIADCRQCPSQFLQCLRCELSLFGRRMAGVCGDRKQLAHTFSPLSIWAPLQVADSRIGVTPVRSNNRLPPEGVGRVDQPRAYKKGDRNAQVLGDRQRLFNHARVAIVKSNPDRLAGKGCAFERLEDLVDRNHLVASEDVFHLGTECLRVVDAVIGKDP